MIAATIAENIPLSGFTTLRVGGPARFLAKVTCLDELDGVLKWAKENAQEWVIIGKGSNLLVSDKGFYGLVVINQIEGESWQIKDNKALVTVGSGMSLASLSARSAKLGFAGLEFACGIPATIGGAVVMNAGAHGLCIESCFEEALVWTEAGMKRLRKEEIDFAYRSSRFQAKKEVVVEATFLLQKDPKALARLREMTEYRLETQPWKEATAGCFFRNPTSPVCGENLSAGALIQKAGLKGYSHKGAKVSELHANFLINRQNASAQDFLELIEDIRQKVKSQFGAHLEGEVKYLEESGSQMRSI